MTHTDKRPHCHGEDCYRRLEELINFVYKSNREFLIDFRKILPIPRRPNEWEMQQKLHQLREKAMGPMTEYFTYLRHVVIEHDFKKEKVPENKGP